MTQINATPPTAEHRRLADSEARRADWKNWGPYVSERAWGTVREDYSPGGDAWDYFPHDHARSRAYRWNEDGLGGFSNRFQNLCLAVALWNERDPILKERLFGVTGPQGNHGEDVKEYYFYLDGTPTHSYQKMLYKYPQVAYPYEQLVAENGRRGDGDAEFELIDALREPFEAGPLLRCRSSSTPRPAKRTSCAASRAVNRGPDPAPIHILPHVWFRNTWSWRTDKARPEARVGRRRNAVHTDATASGRALVVLCDGDAPLLFTENETNTAASVRPAQRHALRQGRHSRGGGAGPGRRGQPGAGRQQGRGALSGRGSPGETFTVQVRFTQRCQRPPLRRLRRHLCPAQRRGRRLLRRHRRPGPERGRAPGAAPGAGRADLEQAVLSLQRGALAGRRPRPADRRRPRAAGPQRRLAASLHAGRALHARQVGVSLVRGLGSGLSHACPSP